MSRLDRKGTIEKAYDIVEMTDAIDFELVDNSSLAGIFCGNEQGFIAHLSCLDRYWQDTFDRQDAPVKPQFANKHVTVGGVYLQKLKGEHHAYSHRQVET